MKTFISVCAVIALIGCGRDAAQGPAEASGPAYAVGSRTFFIHDESRSFDSVAGVDTGIRSLITEVWYPIDADATEGHRRATYGDYVFGNRDMHRLMMTGTTFFHMTPDTVRDGVNEQQIDAAIDELFERERESWVDAPLTASSDMLPVIVMSHGDAGSRYNMESVCEYLAAKGYFVIAAEHTGNSPFAMTGSDPALASDARFSAAMADVLPLLNEHGAYGPPENFGQSYSPLLGDRDPLESLQYLDKSLLQRLNDLRAVLTTLDELNAGGDWAGRLNLQRIGLMGRSFGGATTIMGLAMEPRFTAGFAVVPPAWPDPRPTLPAAALAEPGTESVLLAADGEFPLGTVNKPAVLLSGAEDGLIIGLAASVGATATPDNPHPVLRQVFKSTEAPVVWGLLADSNHGSFGVSGPFWWPDLKPNTQNRHFDPEVSFNLVTPNLAHQMQKELALAFFDVTIRDDDGALQRLQKNNYESQGLELELRNF
jgi:dienelactone hydrolase